MPETRYYAACPHKGKWRVVRLLRYSQQPLHDVRKFKTFGEANQVAQDIAAGKYNWKPGIFINMR